MVSEPQRVVPVTVQDIPMACIKAISGHGILTDSECLWSTRKRVRSECARNKIQTCSIYFWGRIHLFCSFIFFTLSSLSCISSSCLTVNKASRQTRPCVQSRSWPWGSCCGCRLPPPPRSGCSGPGSSGCCPLQRLRFQSKAAGGVGERSPPVPAGPTMENW